LQPTDSNVEALAAWNKQEIIGNIPSVETSKILGTHHSETVQDINWNSMTPKVQAVSKAATRLACVYVTI
jgi:hypothetical protein